MSCDYHLKPNFVLVASSSLFCVPIISLYLKNETMFYQHFNEMLLLSTVSFFSILRWGMPCYIFRKLDQGLAKICFCYYSIQSTQIRKESPLKNGILVVCVYSLFLSSKYSRKHFFKYWYVFHFFFHILSISLIMTLYYNQKLIL
jgi:hypothetical protein